MSDDTNTEGATWLMPKFRFSVDLGDGMNDVSFQEVSGLSVDTQVIEYRNRSGPIFSIVKMPGVAKTGNVTMKRGVVGMDNAFFDWYAQIKMNTIKRRTVTIKLIDESGVVTMQWFLRNAWPTKITGTALKSDGDEVAVESVEFAHEGLEISNS